MIQALFTPCNDIDGWSVLAMKPYYIAISYVQIDTIIYSYIMI